MDASIGVPGANYGGTYRAELDEAEIIRRYAPMVKRVASHLKGRLPETVQLDDLIQSGLIAVLRITRRIDCAHIADAMLRRAVMNAMIDEARRETWAPTRTVRLAKAAGKALHAIKSRTGRDGSDEEVAAQLGIPLNQYHQLLVEIAGIRLLHLDEFDEGGERALQVANTQEEVLHQSRTISALAESIASLPERERLVVSLYYEQQLSMEEVGEVLGLNKSTICRIHGRALLILRNSLADWRAGVDHPASVTGG